MPTVTVYSLGGTWTSAPTFTYTSGVTLEERLNYTDNNGAHDNILDDMFGVGRTNQQGHTSDPTGDADAGTQAIGQTTLFGMNVNGWNVSTGTMFEFLGSDGNTVYGSHIVTNSVLHQLQRDRHSRHWPTGRYQFSPAPKTTLVLGWARVGFYWITTQEAFQKPFLPE